MTQKKCIAVAGCGHWGKNLVRNFSELGALYAVCDNNPEVANAFADKYSVSSLSWDETLDSENVRGVVLASPAPFHYEMAKAALLAGKDVYVEKPITLKNEHAQELCDLAEQNNAVLMVGHLLQYHPAFLKLKSICDEGVLGNLLYIYSNRLSFGKIRREEDVLWSFAPHDVSMILALAGGESPEFVDAVGSAQTHESICDYAYLNLKFQSGLAAHVNVSWLNPFKEQKLIVVGDKGMAVFDDRVSWSEKVMLYAHDVDLSGELPKLNPADGEPLDIEEGEPLKVECQHFLERMADRSKPRTDGAEGMRVLDVLNRADACLKGKLV